MREDLIAYVLGESDAAEAARIEAQLASDPALRQEVEHLRQCLTTAGEAEDSTISDVSLTEDACGESIPRGLVQRTTGKISRICSETEESSLATAPPPNELGRTSSGSCFSLVDFTVATGTLLILGSMLLPALYQSQNRAQKIACQHNLRRLGEHLTQYSHRHHRFYPVVLPQEHAGMYSVRLMESNTVPPEQLANLLVCSASPLAEQLRERGQPLHVPTSCELANARGQFLARLQETSGGSYAYQVGFVKQGRFIPARNRRNCRLPVLSDAPNLASGCTSSTNHGGSLVNVLFQDGSVRSLHNCIVSSSKDHLFLNFQGAAAASTRWDDAVTLPSKATPGVGRLPLPPLVIRIFTFR